MDIGILDPNSLKIKTKNSIFVVDLPSSGGKTACDAVIQLGNSNFTDLSKVSDYRILISGPGEYEINGVKVSSHRIGGGLVLNMLADGLSIAVGMASVMSKIKEEVLSECDIAVVKADVEISDFITGLGPKAVLLYGEFKKQNAKALGKENVSSSKKFTTTKDKLPEEMEVVILE